MQEALAEHRFSMEHQQWPLTGAWFVLQRGTRALGNGSEAAGGSFKPLT